MEYLWIGGVTLKVRDEGSGETITELLNIIVIIQDCLEHKTATMNHGTQPVPSLS